LQLYQSRAGPRLYSVDRSRGYGRREQFKKVRRLGAEGSGKLGRCAVQEDRKRLAEVVRCNGAQTFFPLARALYKDQMTWLNKIQAVGKGAFDGTTLVYELFELK